MTPRTLRAANSGFYIGCIVFIIFACVYTVITRDLSLWAIGTIAIVGIAATVWGGYYATIRYIVDEERVTRKTLFGSISVRWAETIELSCAETESGGVASCQITIQTSVAMMVLSSELLGLDDMQTLAADLRQSALLKDEKMTQNG